MAYVVAATWTASEGNEELVLDCLKKLTPASRAEPGCQYHQAPGASQHFKEYGLEQAIPALEKRERNFYQTIDT